MHKKEKRRKSKALTYKNHKKNEMAEDEMTTMKSVSVSPK